MVSNTVRFSSSNYPVICEDVAKAYGNHVIFHDVNHTINRGEKVAFVGKNGEGKSTLVKCIMDEITDYTGKLTLGHNVQIGYFAQNQAQLLDENLTVFDTIDRVAVGSSSNNTSGRRNNNLASSIRIRQPPENSLVGRSKSSRQKPNP